MDLMSKTLKDSCGSRLQYVFSTPSYETTSWDSLSDDTVKTALMLLQVWHGPNYSKAPSAEHKPKFCSPQTAMETSPCEQKNFKQE
jgi:hypothetical protein